MKDRTQQAITILPHIVHSDLHLPPQVLQTVMKYLHSSNKNRAARTLDFDPLLNYSDSLEKLKSLATRTLDNSPQQKTITITFNTLSSQPPIDKTSVEKERLKPPAKMAPGVCGYHKAV